ncbi:MAG: hypothetical protein N3H30_01970 [Candidatus Micrarchaeota archaeon]|nr:hypothetical protein [Candidatus Micrarchaeota archaeon]
MAERQALESAARETPRESSENYARVVKEFGKIIYDMLPLTWTPEMLQAIRNAETGKELALYVGFSALLLGLDVMDLYPPARAGTRMVKETVENALKKMARRDIDEKAARKAVERIVNAVADNKKVTLESVEAASKEYVDFTKSFFTTKDKSLLYKSLEGEVDNAAEIVTKSLGIADVGALERGIPNIGVGVLDKGKTWLLNAISKELGDAGIAIYLRSIYKNAEKFGVDMIMTGGDEIVVIARDGGADAVRNFYNAVIADMKAEISLMRNASGNPRAFKAIEDAISSVSMHADSATLKIIDGKVKLASPHKTSEPPEFHNLSTFLSRMEARELLAKVSVKHPEATEVLRRFMHLSGEALPKLEKVDGVVVARLGFEPETRRALIVLGEYAEKGTAQAIRANGAGPSLLNLLGHSGPDYFSRKYADSLQEAFRQFGYIVEVGQEGAPLSISYAVKGGKKVGKNELEKITKRADEIFIAKVKKEHPEIGLTGTSTFFARTKESAEAAARKHFTRGLLEGVDEDTVRFRIAYVHLNSTTKRQVAEGLRKFLEDHFGSAFVSPVADTAHRAFENLPAWVRQPEDLVTYLRDTHFSDDEIRSILGYMEGVWR